MIDDIEQAIIDRLSALWPDHGNDTKLSVFDIGKDFEDVTSSAAISIATESIGLRMLPDMTVELKPGIMVYLCFKHVGSGKGRRQGVTPMVLGVIRILIGNDLGLGIEPLLPAGPATEIYHESLKAKGMIGWKIPLFTSFDVDRLADDEAAVKLISEGLYYHLRTDAETNATDELSYE